MKIKIKRLHEKAVIPTYANDGDACMDLTATEVLSTDNYIEYKTGIAIEIPKGFFGLVRPRSSVSKKDLLYKTSGIIDSGYRGEITVRFEGIKGDGGVYVPGDRVAQIIILPYPPIEFEEVDELSNSKRGEGGHGSTGK